jgi:diguanylate cyclase (GGDEF)-like protein
MAALGEESRTLSIGSSGRNDPMASLGDESHEFARHQDILRRNRLGRVRDDQATAADDAPNVVQRGALQLDQMAHEAVAHPVATVKSVVTAPVESFLRTFDTPVQGEEISTARRLRGKGGPTPESTRIAVGDRITAENTPAAITPKEFREAALQTVANVAAPGIASRVGGMAGAALAGAAANAAYSPDDPLAGAVGGVVIGAALHGAGAAAKRVVRGAPARPPVADPLMQRVMADLSSDPTFGRELAAGQAGITRSKPFDPMSQEAVALRRSRTQAEVTRYGPPPEAAEADPMAALGDESHAAPKSVRVIDRRAATKARVGIGREIMAPADAPAPQGLLDERGRPLVKHAAAASPRVRLLPAQPEPTPTRIIRPGETAPTAPMESPTLTEAGRTARIGRRPGGVRPSLLELEQPIGSVGRGRLEAAAPERSPRELLAAKLADGEPVPLGDLAEHPDLLDNLRQRSAGASFGEEPSGMPPTRRGDTPTDLARQLADVTEQRDAARRSAETDALTGLGNRAALDRALPTAEADPHTHVVVFDANDFGLVNKRHGQAVGDRAIGDVGNAVRQAAEESGAGARVFRRGGDEFVVLAPEDAAHRIRARAEQLFGEKTYGPEADAPRVSLTGTVGSTFDEADAGLQAAKTARKAANAPAVPEPPTSIASAADGDAAPAGPITTPSAPAPRDELAFLAAHATEAPSVMPGGSRPRLAGPTPGGLVNLAKFGLDAPLEDRLRAKVTELAADGTLGPKHYQSFADQHAEAKAFARELVADPLSIDQNKLRNLTGAQIVGLHELVAENTALAEAASRALARGELTPEETTAAQRVLDRADGATTEALQAIVRERSQAGRTLGFLRQVAQNTLDPDVWAVKAQQLAGDIPLGDEVLADIRRLAREAADACAGGGA